MASNTDATSALAFSRARDSVTAAAEKSQRRLLGPGGDSTGTPDLAGSLQHRLHGARPQMGTPRPPKMRGGARGYAPKVNAN